MRTLLITFTALTLAVTGLSACGMYFGESSQSNQQFPDAGNTGGGDAGWGNADAQEDGGCCTNTSTGCGDAGYNADAGLPGNDAAWPTDAAWPVDAPPPWQPDAH